MAIMTSPFKHPQTGVYYFRRQDRQLNWSLVLKSAMRYVKALTSTFCMFKLMFKFNALPKR